MSTLPETKQNRSERNYVFLELTKSVCPKCLKLIDAKIVIKNDGKITMLKRCPEHGDFEVLIASDADYYCNTLAYNKPGRIPREFGTSINAGCPNDCGLCPDHEQHTCLALMEITNKCNMNCPICYAGSGQGKHISMDEVKVMLERYVSAEGNPEVLQISGGEPTLHPQLHEILRMAKKTGLKAFLINTNGIRLAEDESLTASLREFGLELEIYLQFDSLTEEVGRRLRGRDMRDVRQKALDNLQRYDICVNLVATVVKGLNEQEIGEIINEAITRPNVTGVVFQILTEVGRAAEIHGNPLERLTVPDILCLIENQTGGVFRRDDFIPLPCPHPTCCSLTYAFVTGDKKKKVKPVTRYIDVRKYLDYFKNTLCIDARNLINEALYHSVDRLWSASASLKLVDVLQDFSRCCGVKFKPDKSTDPLKQIPGKPLRIVIKPFMDAYNYDLKRAKKCCIHVLTTDGRMVPFCNYNIFYRGKGD